jgi:NADH-quinone oxidoreductase subunit C
MSSTTPPDVAPEAPPAGDPTLQTVLGALTGALGDALVGSELSVDDLCVRVERDAWRAAVTFLKEQEGFEYFCFLSGIDWLPSVDAATRYEKIWGEVEEEGVDTDEESSEAEAALAEAAEEEVVSTAMTTGVAGGDSRFQVFCRVYSIARHVGVTLKADLADEDPAVESLTPVFRGADWHEREAWEMYGFDFVGHPGLRHLYLPGEFEGYPLRKDFPLLAREVKPWPGLVNVEAIPEVPEAPAAPSAPSEPAAAEEPAAQAGEPAAEDAQP